MTDRSFELRQRGFTLTEILVAIGVLLAIVLVTGRIFKVMTDVASASTSTTAIMQVLGGRHGYTPASDTAQANCLQLALNAADIWEESYSARRGEDQGAEFCAERLQAWFSTLLGFKAATGSDGPYFFGAGCGESRQTTSDSVAGGGEEQIARHQR